jgi:histidine triad (HIT) family protein
MTNAAVPDCLFCRIVAGEIPANVVHSDDLVLAFHDINPVAPMHILVISRRHLDSASDLAEDDGPLLGRIFTVADRLAGEAGLADRGYRIVTNVGPESGQSVQHLHFHLLGGRRLTWPPG